MKPVTHPVHQLSHHPVPDFSLCIPGSVFPIPHDFQLIFEAAVFRYLGGQIYTVALVAVVVHEKVRVLFQHHVRSFLEDGDKSGKRGSAREVWIKHGGFRDAHVSHWAVMMNTRGVRSKTRRQDPGFYSGCQSKFTVMWLIMESVFTKMVVTMTVLFSIPVDSLANTSLLVTAILSTSFQYPIWRLKRQRTQNPSWRQHVKHRSGFTPIRYSTSLPLMKIITLTFTGPLVFSSITFTE